MHERPPVHAHATLSAAGQARFFASRFLRSPRSVGAVLPAGERLARAMASALAGAHEGLAERDRPHSIYEFGAGTGALTKHIADWRPRLVEKDEELAALLRGCFPDLEVRSECALSVLRSVEEPIGLVSSIPLLNNPQRQELAQLLGRCHAAGLLRFLVLYSYSAFDPLRGIAFASRRRSAVVWKSLPPTSIWVYL